MEVALIADYPMRLELVSRDPGKQLENLATDMSVVVGRRGHHLHTCRYQANRHLCVPARSGSSQETSHVRDQIQRHEKRHGFMGRGHQRSRQGLPRCRECL
jgi:hypothetical protein